MNKVALAKALREQAEKIRSREPHLDSDFDTSELVCVLARILEGKSVEKSFGAPGDWGYSHPIGKALAAAPETEAK